MDLPPKRGRPISYSESHIQFDRVKPLLSPSSSMISFEIEQGSPDKTPSPIQLIIPPPSPPLSAASWLPFLHTWATRFVFHLTLISLFETIFFWQFVSKSEDAALILLVNQYAASTLHSCKTMSPSQRQVTTDFINLFLNQSRVDAAGAIAAASRAAYNDVLVRNSWLYFGGLAFAFSILASISYFKIYAIHWRSLIVENLVLVSLLGLYEWMFFSTIVLKYQAISIPELDRMVVDEIMSVC